MGKILSYLCIGLFTMLFHLNAVKGEEVPSIQQLLVHAHEADEDLAEEPHSSLETSLQQFAEKGGTLIRLEGDEKPFQFAMGDLVFPSCSAGFNRSQTVWNLLRAYETKITLMPPHATRFGFDPYNGKVNWHRARFKPEKKDEFAAWSGVEKSPKLGWNRFADWPSESEATPAVLSKMRDYYDREYYNPDLPEGTRRVYVTFAKNAHAHLYRLCQANESLEGVVVLFFPLEDFIAFPLSAWNTYSCSVRSYEEFSSLLKPYLDLSQLE